MMAHATNSRAHQVPPRVVTVRPVNCERCGTVAASKRRYLTVPLYQPRIFDLCTACDGIIQAELDAATAPAPPPTPEPPPPPNRSARSCSLPTCHAYRSAHGLCRAHYDQAAGEGAFAQLPYIWRGIELPEQRLPDPLKAAQDRNRERREARARRKAEYYHPPKERGAP